MRLKVLLCGLLLAAALPMRVTAQAPPRLVRFNGVVRDAHGQPVAGAMTTLTFAVYREAEGGAPVWVESQVVSLDAAGRYAVLLGAMQPDGLPADLFASGEARWLGIQAAGQAESPRVLMVSVPYALKAGDADTVGGLPASAFVLATDVIGGSREDLQLSTRSGADRATGAVTGSEGRAVTSRVGLALVSGGMAATTATATGAAGATALAKDNVVGGMSVTGSTSSATSVGDVMFKAAESWTDTAHGTYLTMTTTPAGALAGVERVRIDSRGYVGIGTATPGAALHVAGDAVVDGNVAAKYQDVAEWVASAETLSPGTVVVVDGARSNGVLGSRRAYDVAVVGAVSERPGVMLGERGPGKVLVAQSGRVRVKVDATYGAIRAGDLLVTSPTPGYAMRSRPLRVNGTKVHRPGTILGKALEPLAQGRGEILVLLTLQ
jgi:hypothetical protein